MSDHDLELTVGHSSPKASTPPSADSPTLSAKHPASPVDAQAHADSSPHSTGGAPRASASPAAGSADDLPTIPGFAVQSEIARGGMGRVLAARDITLDRQVAIKVLLPGQSSAEAARRFVRESKITAHLPHPAIPPVYALGPLPDGSPYLAMKLIRGETLAAILKSRAEARDDLPRLIAVFEQVAQAVGFAHAQQIVHRDLKPANVMVGAFGEVQVMDWGLAKRLDVAEPSEAPTVRELSPDSTQTGQVLGTPAYMAPEQARGEGVDARADVFALGGILCEILTGRPPFTGNSTFEVLARASAGDVRDAAERLAQVTGEAELCELARRCLAPYPEERPANAKELADAVAAHQAHVEDLLAKAQRDRALTETRVQEQRKRRWIELALAAAVGLLIMLGGMFAVSLERHRAAARAQKVAEENAEHERLARNAAAIDELLEQCETDLQAADPRRVAVPFAEVKRRMTEGGGDPHQARFERVRADLAMLEDLERIDQDFWLPLSGDYQVQVALARWREAFGRFGIVPGKTPHDEIARRFQESLIRERMLPSFEGWLLYDRSPLGAELMRVLDPDPFRDQVRAALFAQDAVKLRELVTRPEATQQPPRFAALLGHATTLAPGRVEEILRGAHRRQPGNPVLLLALAAAARGETPEALAERIGWFRAALVVRPESAALWANLGVCLAQRKDYAAALEANREAVRLAPRSAHAHFALAHLLTEQGQTAEAIAEYREAVRLDPSDARHHNNLGAQLMDKKDRTDGDITEAMALFRETLRLNPAHPTAHYSLGRAHHIRLDFAPAIAEYRAAVKQDPKLAAYRQHLAKALQDAGQAQASIAEYREAIKLDGSRPATHHSLAGVLFGEGDFAGAIVSAREALRLSPEDPNIHNTLGAALLESGDVEQAVLHFRRAIKIDPKYERAIKNLDAALKIKAEMEK